MYTCEFEAVAIAATQDAFEFAPADDKPIFLAGLDISNASGAADMGDAQEESLRWRIIRGHATTGTGGSTATPRPLDPSGPAAGFVCEINNTTIASAGTAVNMGSFGRNNRINSGDLWPEELWVGCSQSVGALLVVRLMANPADSIAMSGTAWVYEVG